METQDMGVAQLYRHYDRDGTLLYVGVSLNAIHRLSQHKGCSDWFDQIARVEIESFGNREAALVAERRAIDSENPRCNVLFARRGPRWRQHVQDSADDITRSVVFKPIYTVEQVAELLDARPAAIRKLIESGKLGAVAIENGRHKPRTRITGWQLIEYLEAKQAAARRNVAA
jgi:excisionase family DNA binding protein